MCIHWLTKDKGGGEIGKENRSGSSTPPENGSANLRGGGRGSEGRSARGRGRYPTTGWSMLATSRVIKLQYSVFERAVLKKKCKLYELSLLSRLKTEMTARSLHGICRLTVLMKFLEMVLKKRREWMTSRWQLEEN